MKILLKDVRLQVRVGESFGEKIETNIGVPQGDCLSPILFTLYLAEAMKDERSVLEEEHSYSKHQEDTNNVKPAVLEEHNYSKIQHKSFFIDHQYADDIGWIGVNAAHKTEHIKNKIPKKLAERNLQVNKDKTEEYIIERNSNTWRKCKYLGSLLGTEEDLKRRKGLVIYT
jgi:hypothetical protein